MQPHTAPHMLVGIAGLLGVMHTCYSAKEHSLITPLHVRLANELMLSIPSSTKTTSMPAQPDFHQQAAEELEHIELNLMATKLRITRSRCLRCA